MRIHVKSTITVSLFLLSSLAYCDTCSETNSNAQSINKCRELYQQYGREDKARQETFKKESDAIAKDFFSKSATNKGSKPSTGIAR